MSLSLLEVFRYLRCYIVYLSLSSLLFLHAFKYVQLFIAVDLCDPRSFSCLKPYSFQISLNTMESRIQSHLFFAGEVYIAVDDISLVSFYE